MPELIYRVHHTDAVCDGMYSSNVAQTLYDVDQHPNPSKDPNFTKIFDEKRICFYLFGFNDIKQLKNWVPKHILERLYDDNYVCSKVLVADTIKGEKQVIFHEKHIIEYTNLKLKDIY